MLKYLLGFIGYLDRALLNIISYALKFTEDGYVKVTHSWLDQAGKLCEKGNEITIQLSIEDTGISIPQDKFEDFWGISRV